MSVPAAMLQVEGINTYRGPAQILRGVSLRVGAAEAVCLVGRNGAGKTTTIDSIMGLLSVRGGTITFKGEDVTRLPAHRRARMGIGYAPEDTGIFPDLTVAENFQVSEWLSRAETSAAAAEERTFGIFPEVKTFLGRRGLHLSGGQKKMVAIARAMTLSPSILLLDEPLEGLAPLVVTRFIDAVKRIKALGISILIAESSVVNATRVADRLYAIDRGEIIYAGDPRTVFDNEEVMKTIRG
ncbi:MAG: ABC transporter ATP-binding protein [Candidatus Rokubacteria bacterium]|nr:ABC transporter ATP-binding protein [Candidatus Rokubacteria bacterium]MBI3824380.1 ABC transporter ATP-binding protein [Candidatus Rokubacteria bacterium]